MKKQKELDVLCEVAYCERTAPETTDLSAVKASLAFLKSSSATLSMIDRLFRKQNLSLGRFNLLILLDAYKNVKLTVALLSRRMSVRDSSTNQLLDSLRKDKLVEGYALTLTGKALITRLLPDYWNLMAMLSESLDAEERGVMTRSMEKILSGVVSLVKG